MLRPFFFLLCTGVVSAADLLDPQLVAVSEPTNERIALLIAAGDYPDASWNLANSAADLTAISETLALGADLAPAFQLQLKGKDVTVRGVQKAVKQAAARLSNPGTGGEGLLIIYWSGHAFTDPTGKQVYFTANTEPDVAVEGVPSYSDTVSRDALLGWVGDARAERSAAGVRFRPVIINDICRIMVKAPPRTALFRPESAWEWFGTAAGEFSLSSQRSTMPSAFTQQLRAVLPQQARLGKPQPLTDTAPLVASAMQGQKPELKAPEGNTDAPSLVRAIKARPNVRLIDACSKAPLPRGTLAIDGAAAQEILIDQQVPLNVGPGRRLQAQAPGYLANQIDVEAVSAELSGKALLIPLYPEVVVIRGKVAGGRMEARVLNCQAELRADAHRVVTMTDATGAFELILPRIEAGLTVSVGGRSFVIPSDPSKWSPGNFKERLTVPTYEVEKGRAIVPASGLPAVIATPPPNVPQAQAVDLKPAVITATMPLTSSSTPPSIAPSIEGSKSGPRVAEPKKSSAVSAVRLSRPQVPGVWPLAITVKPTPATVLADGSFDLTALGSADGTVPNRIDAVPRENVIIDLCEAGTAPGEILATRSDPIARVRQVIDLTAAGTAPNDAPHAEAAPVVRQRKIVDLSRAGTFVGYAPLPPIDPIERAEAIVDLTNDGNGPDGFAIPEQLAKDLATAVLP